MCGKKGEENVRRMCESVSEGVMMVLSRDGEGSRRMRTSSLLCKVRRMS